MSRLGVLTLLVEQASGRGSRSTALYAMQWAMGILISAILGSLWVGAPTWLLIILAGLLIIVVGLFVVAFCVLLVKNPDALRSERFTLSKMAIERGLIGDNLTGLVDADRPKLTPLPSAKREVPKLEDR